jgi:hypothetical protein
VKRELTRVIRKLLRERAAGATICPSEVARSLDAVGWRQHLSEVRAVAVELAEAGELVIMQRGRPVDGRRARGPIRIGHGDIQQAAYVNAYRGIDFREHPELYRVGRGEQGVLVAEPYKSELLPLWRFKDEKIARRSALALWKAFIGYRKARDHVGMDMARKFLQMGFTRARRYANHRSGRKYAARDVAQPRVARETLPVAVDAEKARAASVFLAYWQKAEKDRIYAAWRRSMQAPAASSSRAKQPSAPGRQPRRTSAVKRAR